MMLRVKICGITRLEDALLAAQLGADAVGFVFFEKSPRFISPKVVAEIALQLPAHVARVGVFVDPQPSFTLEAVEAVGLDAIQLHGISDPQKLTAFEKRPLILAIAVKDQMILQTVVELAPLVDALLLDTYHPALPGGTGKTFNWELAAPVAEQFHIILAGGLTPGNVSAAVKTVRPYAVDVSSGVEVAPGIKDPEKLTLFFKNLREYRRGWKPQKDRLFPLA
jgi:phosphoribosylanthranilate isomerase